MGVSGSDGIGWDGKLHQNFEGAGNRYVSRVRISGHFFLTVVSTTGIGRGTGPVPVSQFWTISQLVGIPSCNLPDATAEKFKNGY